MPTVRMERAVRLLTEIFEPYRPARRPLPWAALAAAALTIAAVGAAGLALERLDNSLRDVGRGIANAAVHTGFLVGGAIAGAGARLATVTLAGRAGVGLFLGSIASRFSPWGALLYLLAPIVLFVHARQDPAFRRLGVTRPSLRASIFGVAAGASLSAHLLLSASLTLGYAVRMSHLGEYLAAAAYDIGASGLSAEWLFRGAILSRCWQRWEFWPAAGVSTALAVVRYLLDPALPSAVEVRVGAVFYTALLGVSACALRAASGSLLPGYLATVVFFLGYRLLAP